MTIIYQYRVATASLGGFGKLLFHWRGSVYKLMYKEMVIFCGIYTALSITYRHFLSEQQRRVFEMVSIHCNSYTSLIPVSFVLGFYVAVVVSRWWKQFMNIPWPDHALFMVNCYVRGQDEQGRMLRRTVARYLLFSKVLICRSISVAVMKRFPTMHHIIEAGIATKSDVEMYESVDCDYNKFWIPVIWANNLMATARVEGRVTTDFGLRMIIEQLAEFRNKCSLCFMNDWVTVPLVYTQVVTLAVYMFFGACLLGRQFLDPSQGYDNYNYDFYVPVFTLMQFFFYMGWLKVAEQLINPFGEDDDDLDINWLIDRHLSVSMTIVDRCHGQFPPLSRDIHWDHQKISDLPYTEASIGSKKPFYLGSTYNLRRPSLEEQRIVIQEDEDRRPSVSHLKSLSRPSSLITLLSKKSSIFKTGASRSRDYLFSAANNEHSHEENQSHWSQLMQNCPANDNNPNTELGTCPKAVMAKSLYNCLQDTGSTGSERQENCDRAPGQQSKAVSSSHPELYWKNQVITEDPQGTPEPSRTDDKITKPFPEHSAENLSLRIFESILEDNKPKTKPNSHRKRKTSCPVFPSTKDIVSAWELERGENLLTASKTPTLSSIDESDTGNGSFVLNI